MLEIGTMLVNRYEILELIGTGGMAYVYKAKCHKLNRLVAIKILKKDFCGDKEFINKFRREAQAAACLSHSNIVGVYDVGETEGIHYIVMELIDGITLKEYITRKHRLGIKEAIGISIQVAQGLSAAHNQNIVHRDIKPQNIIISRDGKIKVTDFGIARAITDETTNTYGAAGSVHYISPEQARGVYCDARSDIYSLGITMYEMITGRVPFDGDSTVTVALAHINDTMIPPSRYVPDVSLAFEQIIYKCTQKKPELRYNSCEELIADLRQAIVQPDANFVKLSMPEKVTGETIIMNDKEISDIRRKSERPTDSEFSEKNSSDVRRRTFERPSDSGFSEKKSSDIRRTFERPSDPDFSERKEPEEIQKALNFSREKTVPKTEIGQDSERKANTENAIYPSRPEFVKVASKQNEDTELNGEFDSLKNQLSEQNPPVTFSDKDLLTDPKEDDPALQENTLFDKILLGTGVTLGLVMLGLVIFIVGNITGFFGKKTVANELTSMAVISIEETTEVSEDTEESILKEITKTEEETTKADEEVTMPQVLGCTPDEASEKLLKAGLSVKFSGSYVYSDNYDAGTIGEQQYKKGTKLKKNTQVTLKISRGSDKIKLTDEFIGGTIDYFKYYTKAYDLDVEYIAEYNDKIKRDFIIDIDPLDKLLEEGAHVKVYYSAGPEYVEVPDLTGMTKNAAASALSKAGLSLGNVSQNYSNYVQYDLVCSQSKSVGEVVQADTSIDIVLSLGGKLVAVPYVIGTETSYAQAVIGQAGLNCTVEERSDNSVTAGLIISQSIDGGVEVDEGTNVHLVVSTGVEATWVPDVKYTTESNAESTLIANGFSVAKTYESSDAVGKGLVIRTSYASPAHKGDVITIVISTGTTTQQYWESQTTTTQAWTEAPTTTQWWTEAPTTTTQAWTEAPTTTQWWTEAPTTTQAWTEAPTTTQWWTEAPTTTQAWTEAPTTTTQAWTEAPTATTQAWTEATTAGTWWTEAPTTEPVWGQSADPSWKDAPEEPSGEQ